MTVVYGLYGYEHGDAYSQAVSSLYLTFKSCLWGVCLAWVVYACSTGNGGKSSLLGPARLLQVLKVFVCTCYLVVCLSVCLMASQFGWIIDLSVCLPMHTCVTPCLFMLVYLFLPVCLLERYLFS